MKTKKGQHTGRKNIGLDFGLDGGLNEGLDGGLDEGRDG